MLVFVMNVEIKFEGGKNMPKKQRDYSKWVKEFHNLGVLRKDEDILNISLITSYFNFVNRIAIGLGVEFSDD